MVQSIPPHNFSHPTPSFPPQRSQTKPVNFFHVINEVHARNLRQKKAPISKGWWQKIKELLSWLGSWFACCFSKSIPQCDYVSFSTPIKDSTLISPLPNSCFIDAFIHAMFNHSHMQEMLRQQVEESLFHTLQKQYTNNHSQHPTDILLNKIASEQELKWLKDLIDKHGGRQGDIQEVWQAFINNHGSRPNPFVWETRTSEEQYQSDNQLILNLISEDQEDQNATATWPSLLHAALSVEKNSKSIHYQFQTLPTALSICCIRYNISDPVHPKDQRKTAPATNASRPLESCLTFTIPAEELCDQQQTATYAIKFFACYSGISTQGHYYVYAQDTNGSWFRKDGSLSTCIPSDDQGLIYDFQHNSVLLLATQVKSAASPG